MEKKCHLETTLVDKKLYDRLVSTSTAKPVFVLGELSADEMLKFQKKAFRAFYFRPGYVLGRLLRIKSLEELKQGYVGVKALIAHQLRKVSK